MTEILNFTNTPIIIFSFLISAGVALYVSIQSLIIGTVGKHAPQLHLSFAFTCLVASGFQITSALYYISSTVVDAAIVLQWQVGFVILLLPGLVTFITLYTGLKLNKRYLITAIVFFGVCLIINFNSPYSLRFTELTVMPPLVLPWGESLIQYSGTPGNMNFLFRLIAITSLFWSLWRGVIQYRRGEKRAAILLLICIILLIVSAIWGGLIDAGVISSFYTAVFAYLLLVLLMSFSLGAEIRAQALSLHEQIMKRGEAEARAEYFTQFVSILNNTAESIITADMSGIIINANKATENMFGYESHKLIGQNVSILIPSEHAEQHDKYISHYKATDKNSVIGRGRELYARREDGSRFPVLIYISSFNWHEAHYLIASITDITERKKLEQEQESYRQQLEKLSNCDGLTGLFNNRHLKEILEIEFNRSYRYKTPLCCILLDIDFFKSINDTYGHLFGDFVLKTVASVIKEGCRKSDFTGRYGGEEFVVLLPNTDLNQARLFAKKLFEAIKTTDYCDDKNQISITVSVGVSFFHDGIEKYTDILAEADQAMYQAKNSGRDRICVFGQDKTS